MKKTESAPKGNDLAPKGAKYYQTLLEKFLSCKLIHERAYVLEEIMRWLENKINRHVNDNSPEMLSQVAKTYELHLSKFTQFAQEKVIIQKILISTGMLLFAITCRLELHMHEPSWRDTDAHIQFSHIAPKLVEEDFIPDNMDPILFLDVGSALQILLKIQRFWYVQTFDVEVIYQVIKWIERRFSILLTFPFDKDTFNLPQYRQKHGNVYMANFALLFDCYALITSMYVDINWFKKYQKDLVSPNTWDDQQIQKFLVKIMTNTQGDNLCIQYQKQYIESRVRIGDPLIFSRRRTEVVGPSHMDIITECNGQTYAREVHGKADVRLLEIYELPENHENIWQVVTDYFTNQKISFPWIKACFINRFKESCSYEPLENYKHPMVIHIPVINQYGHFSPTNQKIQVHPCFLQALLGWCHDVKQNHQMKVKFKGINYDFTEIFEEFLGDTPTGTRTE